ncbi:hypothetical protein FR943_06675 [Mycobacterium sp. TNTM28]|uniref:PE-PPE domain-containing protein n=1 Tax=[Mycobacterium] fortunisiensis TaxID=2600579 RepID=A0ABS6KIW3_9MYCO|nr:hypothetical protein [[Mycobacterium] fortunisiensis]MBU9763526.1 hypothetical protein [[Mycobacterium] fortunisiensis]
MAVRPFVTTGAALLSAGALVVATPALFVPRDEVKVAAPATAPRLTQQQIDLLALSLQGAWQAFTQGYGGLWFPGDGGPGDCTAEGAVCQKGFTGLAYYLSDNILPLGDVDNIFFEGGFTELAHQAVRAVAVVIDAIDPTGRLDLTKRVDDFFEGGATQLVGNLLLDNLPEDGYAYGLTKAFFFEYGDNTGIYAAFTYVVDAIAQGTPDPVPNLINPLDNSSPTMLLAQAELNAEPETEARPATTSDPASVDLPRPGRLLNLPTVQLDLPVRKFRAPVAEKPVEEPEVQDQSRLDATVERGAEQVPAVDDLPVDEPVAAESPESREPAKPHVKPWSRVKEKVAEEKSDESDERGVDTAGGNKVSPPVLFDNGRQKGETNGSRFLKNLEKAVNHATGADKGAGSDGAGSDGAKGADGDK